MQDTGRDDNGQNVMQTSAFTNHRGVREASRSKGELNRAEWLPAAAFSHQSQTKLNMTSVLVSEHHKVKANTQENYIT